jgi:uncharacterized protein YjiK
MITSTPLASLSLGIALCTAWGCYSDADADSDSDSDSDSVSDAGVACPPLSSYGLVKDVTLEEIPLDGSGIAWDRDTGTFFVVANLQGEIWEYDAAFETLLRTIELVDIDEDAEGLEYLENGWLAIAAETNTVFVAQVGDGVTSVSGAGGAAQIFEPCDAPPVANAGFEGIAFRRTKGDVPGRIFVCEEYQPMRVLSFDWMVGSPPFDPASYADGSLDVYEPWDAEDVLSPYVDDLAGMAYDETSDTLLIVSQISASVIRVDPETGAVLEEMALQDTATAEGLAIFDTCELAVMSEPNHLQVYASLK